MTPEEMNKVARKVVITLGDRRNSGFCIKCGDTLLEPFNDFQCCTGCTKTIHECQDHVAFAKQGGKKMPLKHGGIVINKKDVLRQVAPLGVPTRK